MKGDDVREDEVEGQPLVLWDRNGGCVCAIPVAMGIGWHFREIRLSDRQHGPSLGNMDWGICLCNHSNNRCRCGV